MYNKTFQYRLYPTKQQEQELIKTLGCCRFVWNKLLEKSIEHHKKTGKFILGYDLQNLLPKLKQEFTFLQEPNSQSLQAISDRLTKTFKRKFKGISEFPKFKSKKNNINSCVVPQHFNVFNNHIQIPKFSKIKYNNSRPYKGKPKQLIITRDVNHWYVNVVCELEDPNYQINQNSKVGIDVGIKNLVTLSNGEQYNLPESLKKTNEQIKKLQRKHSRKKKGSKNREKARIKLAKKYQQYRFQKRDFFHKLSTSITKKFDIIVTEDLNINGMKKNKNLSSKIHQCSWYQFKTYLQHKSKQFEQVDRFYPSSKTCSNCGHVKQNLTLKDRIYNCHDCGNSIDRDINAAINIKNYKYNNTVGSTGINACGDLVKLQDIEVGSLKQEKLEIA